VNDRDDQLTPEAERAMRAIHAAGAEPPRADSAFRGRLREEFVSGRLGGGAERAPEGDRAERRPRLDRVPERMPRPWYRRPIPAFAALAAAAMVAVYVGNAANRGPAWTVVEASGSGVVTVDGDPIPIERTDMLADRMKPGVEVEVPETGKLEILSPGTLLVELTPGTKLTIPPPPPRFLARQGELWTRAGLLRITTGPMFAGATLDVHTPDAHTRITGTTVAIIMEETGTCVCVLEGTVHVGPQSGGPMMSIGPGHRGYVFRDGSPPVTDRIRETELVSLARFRSTRLHMLGGEPSK
jgi:ferric-dicitrate binding protein FerR (iron transport regulator)